MRHRFHLSWLLLLIFYTLPFSSRAQLGEYRQYTYHDGLPCNQLRNVMQLPDRRMLVLCEGTFCLFDGSQFSPIECNLSQVAHIEGNSATLRRYIARDGSWWMVRFNHLHHFDPLRCCFLYDTNKLLTASGVQERLVNFYLDGEGQAWLLTQKHKLYRYDWQHKASLVTHFNRKEIDDNVSISTIIVTKKHYLLLYSDDRLVILNRKTLKPIKVLTNILLPNGTTKELRTQLGDVKILTLDSLHLFLYSDVCHAQICVLNLKTLSRQWLRTNGYVGGLVLSNKNQRLTASSFGQLMTYDLTQLNRQIDGATLIPDSCIDQFSISPTQAIQDKLLDICRDNQGGLWIATASKGLLYHSGQQHNITTISGMNGTVTQIFPLDNNHTLIGTTTRTYLMNGQGEVIPYEAAPAVKCNQISRDRKGRLWICTFGGLVCIKQGQIITYNSNNTKNLHDDNFSFCCPIDDQRCLVCVRFCQLGILYPTSHSYHIIDDPSQEYLKKHYITSAIPDPTHHRIILASQNGMLQLDTRTMKSTPLPQSEKWANYSNKINCQLLDSQQRLWLGTQCGLMVCLPHGSVRRITQEDGINGNCIQGLIESRDKKHIWVSTSSGLNCLTPTSQSLTEGISIYDSQDGMLDGEIYERALTQMPNGNIAVGCTEGLSIVKSYELSDKRFCPQARLVGMTLCNEEVTSSGLFQGRELFKKGFLQSQGMKLNYDENYLTLRFSAIDYQNPHQVHYRYRLNDSSQKWQEVQSPDGVCKATYTDLQPGHYTFLVQVRQPDGQWESNSISWNITITPPIWKTWWAKVIYFILLVVAIVYTIQLYQLYRRKRILLLLRIRKIIRKLTPANNQKEGNWIKLQDVEIQNQDEEFLGRVIKCIEAHLEEDNYTVDDLSNEVGVARTHFYRRMQNLTGQTPSDFIMEIRLRHAATLLIESGMNIQQIAYKVGFKTPRTFSSRFRERYGMLPSEYAKSHLKAE